MKALLQIQSLWLRDMRHFLRQPSRIIGAIGQPVLVWLLLSAGFDKSFTTTGAQSYGDYLFPGIIVLMALFAAIFSTISIIEDRRSGFLQGVLTSPISTPTFVLAKLLSGSSLALIQSIVFLLLLPFTTIPVSFTSITLGFIVLLLIGMTMTNIGLLLAWKMKSTQGFHAVMSLVLIPMWLLSGAFFPVDGAAEWLQVLVRINPMHYLMALFQQTFIAVPVHITSLAPHAALGVSLAFFLILSALSIRTVRTT